MPERIEEIIGELSASLTPDQAIEGWTERSKKGLLPFFVNLLDHIREDRAIPYIGVIRSLDTWGVSCGDLHDKIISVSNELNSRRR